MEYDAEHGPSPTSAEARNAKPGTDPFVVGAVDDVQLKVTSDTGRAPTGLTLDVVDPGTSGADASPEPITPDEAAEIAPPSPAKSTSPANMPVAARSATPMPNIYSRADWGADERLRDCCVEYGEVHAGFVHHTVNANGYSRREVPAILRGIYAYHTQSRGWRDIGYNYLIDRFGRIWEGRYGGITMPVVGAHTLDYNENSFAASAIGNYETAQPSSAMIDAYARLYAWKLSLARRPTGDASERRGYDVQRDQRAPRRGPDRVPRPLPLRQDPHDHREGQAVPAHLHRPRPAALLHQRQAAGPADAQAWPGGGRAWHGSARLRRPDGVVDVVRRDGPGGARPRRHG